MTTSVDPPDGTSKPAVPSDDSADSGVRVVAFGGGTGMSALLQGLKAYTRNITAVVTVTDNGGSSGRLRNDFDIAAPGDIRNCLIALADIDPLIAEAFQYRFHEAEFKDHSFGNLFITVLTRIVGNFADSIRALNRLLKVQGRVIPATSTRVSLVAHHQDGTKSTGEVEITRSRKRIERIEIRPFPVPLSGEIREAIRDADLFLFGPGSLFTSVIPNLLLDGIVDAINANGSPRVYIGNIMTQPGETDGFQLSDHIRALRRHVGEDFPDCVIGHRGALPPLVLEKYAVEGAQPVLEDIVGKPEFQNIRVIARNFYRPGEGRPAHAARHDSALLARAIEDELLEPIRAGEHAGGRTSGSSPGTAVEDGASAPGRGRRRASPAASTVSPPQHSHGTRALD